MQARRYTVGIDEVGRGSLAGPLFVAAVAIPNSFRSREPLKDSKKLTPRQREKWFKELKSHPKVNFAISKIYPRAIEKKNVSKAANLAALRAYNRLTSIIESRSSNTKVYLDGGLYLGNGKSRIPAKTVTRGDEKYAAIKIASIIAKVSRDRTMTRLAEKYPKYKLDLHKGYGTRIHLAAIKKFGPAEIHRLTFVSFLKNSKPKA